VEAGPADPLLKALDDLAATLAESPTLDQLLMRLASCAQGAVGGEVGRLILFETAERGGPVITAAGGDGGSELRGTALAPGEGLAALVALTEAPILLARPAEHPRYSPRCDDLGRGAGLLGVPVRHGAVRGALLVAGRRAEDLRPAHQDRLVRLGRHAAIAIAGVLAEERSLDAFTHTSDLLVSFLEQIDTLFASHSRNVAALADMLGSRLGLSDTEQLRLHFAALLHDVGKLRVDPSLLRTADPLSEEARRLLHGHVALGLQLLAPITPWPEMLEWIHGHHERWDGTGYPRGLAGERIPLCSRIIAVADVFDAMTSRGLSPEEALTALEAVSGTQLDPRVVAQFASEQRDRLSRFQKA
jgi:hypothetical protein